MQDFPLCTSFHLPILLPASALCHALHLPQTAFDILLFLANNPEYRTASDIVEFRKIKANLVSVNVDRLVSERLSDQRSSTFRPAQNIAFLYRKSRAHY